jgi:hypothetical protein
VVAATQAPIPGMSGVADEERSKSKKEILLHSLLNSYRYLQINVDLLNLSIAYPDWEVQGSFIMDVSVGG